MKKIALVLFLLAFIFIATGCGNGSPWIWLGSSDDNGSDSAEVEEVQDEPDEIVVESTPGDDAEPYDDNADADALNGDDAYIERNLDERLFGIWTTDLSDTGDFFGVDLSMWESSYEFREDGIATHTSGPSAITFPFVWYADGDTVYLRAFIGGSGGTRNYMPQSDRILTVTWISDDNISVYNQQSGSELVLYRVFD